MANKILKYFTPLAWGSNKSPHQEALPYLNQVPQFGREAYQPYINQGQQAAGGLPNYQQMAQDPTSFLNTIMSQYQPSAGYERQYGNAMKAIGAAGAQGGYAGTPFHQEQAGELANSLLSDDMQRFLENVLGIQGFGTAGLENQIGRGFEASGNMADYLGGAYGNLAGSAFEGRAGKNQSSAALKNALLGLLGQAAGGMAGGGAGGGAMGGRYGGTPGQYTPLNSVGGNRRY